MSVRDVIQAAAGSATGDSKQFIEDLFAVHLYTGNGSTQTINNGIDLAGKGGMVWTKCRSNAQSNGLWDTQRGATKYLVSDNTNAESTYSGLTAFNSTGFNLGAGSEWNQNTYTYASWTFRKAPKFFDVVTYTGNGTASKTISHSLGVEPGMIIVKATSTSGNWTVASRYNSTYMFLGGKGTTSEFILNGTNDGYTIQSYVDMGATSTSIDVAKLKRNNGNTAFDYSDTNSSGVSYVAYLFAHDTTTDGLIQCGSYTGTGAVGNNVTLGWEPQYILVKRTDSSSSWVLQDSMRGMSQTNLEYLLANTSGYAFNDGVGYLIPNATGFSLNTALAPWNASGGTYIYMAIRRGPMRTPTDGTKVFAPVARTGTGTATTVNTGIITDLFIPKHRNDAFSYRWVDRLRDNMYLDSSATGFESSNTAVYPLNCFDNMTGVDIGNSGTVNTSGSSYINYAFKRAPGFFDVVCYTGTGVARTVNHNLGVAPELMIFKIRSSTDNWQVYCKALDESGNSYLLLNDTAAAQTNGSTRFTGAPTSTQINLSTNGSVNGSSSTYVAYLFASCPGVSKVGSYTGNGSSRTINCGFSAGARFVLIKRTDSTGDWYVWDTARGIVAGTDPHLSLNTTAAEVTSNDTIDPNSTGFIVNQVTATNVNVSGASYIFLSIA